jgi:SAM-dependent methyltransferase
MLLQPGAHSVLDLGCGTGGHAVLLAEMGHEVHGVDLSAAMLARAEEQRQALAPALAARLRFGQADVRSLELGQNFDAAVALFHVLSYQTTDDDLAAALHAASRHLHPGGVLLFDFWYGPAVLSDPPAVRVKRVEDEKLRVTRIAEPLMHHGDNGVAVQYHLFAEDKLSGAIEQVHETHRLRYWFWPELQRHMRAAGLEPLGLWAWLSESPADASSWLAYAVGRRVGAAGAA